MSLEQALDRCAQALESLAKAFSQRADHVEPSSTNATQRKSAKQNPEQQQTVASVPTPPTDTEVGPDLYKQAATAITSLSRQKGREAALGVLATFGASKLPAVPPERLQEVIDAAEKAMGAAE